MSTDVKIKAPFKSKEAGNISPGQLFNLFWLCLNPLGHQVELSNRLLATSIRSPEKELGPGIESD